jgi:hypothetical protein
MMMIILIFLIKIKALIFNKTNPVILVKIIILVSNKIINQAYFKELIISKVIFKINLISIIIINPKVTILIKILIILGKFPFNNSLNPQISVIITTIILIIILIQMDF